MGALSQIVKWDKGLPDWQSDAVRRILIKGDIAENDRRDLLAVLKKSKGIEDPHNPAPAPIRLQASDVPGPSDSKSVVILKSMHGVKNVNRLAPSQTLEFASAGVTVIYGGNASGKSGYSRVLKKACRARGQVEDILPNVFASYRPNAVAEACFDITIDGKGHKEQWVDKQPAPDSLASIAVFDAEAARFYVDERNEVVYIPYGMDVFTKLGALCRRLKEQLETELGSIEVLPKELTDLAPTTSVGHLIQSLTYETKLSEVEKLVELTESDLKRVEKLRGLVTQMEAKRPEVMAGQCRRFRSRIEKLRDGIIALDNGLSAKKCDNLRSLQTKAREAAEAARLASEEVFKKQPLQGVGSGPWKDMFEAARRYSESVAYLGHPFPYIAVDSRCVLCQQPLGEEAKRRMQSFEKFIKQDTARRAEKAQTEVRQEWDNFCSLQLHPDSADPAIVEEIGEADQNCKELLVQYLTSASTLATSIRQDYEKHQWGEPVALSPTPVPCLNALAEAMETKAKEYDVSAQPEEQRKLRLEFEELNARKVLSTHKPLVISHVNKKVYQHRILQCINDTDTREISLRNRAIMGEAVTQVLKNNLDDELCSLGAGHIKLDLVSEVRAGTTFHCLKLNSATHGNVSVSSVLSEGEKRVVALASLLAEVRTASYSSSLVFDDPVSSLDHIWRHKVAKRLVREGEKRQVIIFTHDIAFLFAIQKECDEQGVPLYKTSMESGPEGCGMCNPPYGVPWEAMKVQERVQRLYLRCNEAEEEYKAKHMDVYRDLSRNCYVLLRKCWEKTVEEILFNKVVERFDEEIKTQRLASVLVTDEDFRLISHAMSKCSDPSHDEPAVDNSPPPPPEEIRQDIKYLDQFVRETHKRNVSLEEKRKKSLEAPAPNLS